MNGSSIIDADVHVDAPYLEALHPYLSDHWIEHFTQSLDRGASPPAPPAPGAPKLTRNTWHAPPYYPPNSPVADRAGSAGAVDGSGLERLRREVLAADGVEAAVTSCLYPVDRLGNPDAAAALARAVNDWQIEHWLEREPRLRGSIVVPIQIPALAVAEIERVGGHPGFVQVLLPVRTEHPLGNRLYHPLWAAIERHDLVAGVHFGGQPNTPPTPTGWPSYYIETYAAMAQVFATQLVSIIVEGVFDACPGVRVAFLESGFTWLPAHLWRMDKEWKNLRRLVPWVRRPPSDYVREHVRIGIQPLDAPPTAAQMLQIVDQLGSDDLLMYTSDFPHVHLFDAGEKLLDLLPRSMQNKVTSETARRLYRLDDGQGAQEHG